MKLVQRESGYYLVRRVPVRYHRVEKRRQIWVALNTDSKKLADTKAEAAWEQLCESWEARLAGDTSEADARYEAARNIAKSRGYRYLEAKDVADLPLDQIVDRISDSYDNLERAIPAEAEALLGAVPKPEITLKRALELYWPMAKDKIRGKSKDQIRRWENPRKKAFKNLISVVGNITLNDMSPDDMLDFQDWWNERIDKEGLRPNSAKKDIAHISSALNLVNTRQRLGFNLPLSGYRIGEGEKRTRPAFSEKWIREKMLAPGALDGLNADARSILIGMINTGYRPSEAECMTRDQIHLEANIPYIYPLSQ